jgi:putative methionine-R-sulfoxide reductase with GAF domain
MTTDSILKVSAIIVSSALAGFSLLFAIKKDFTPYPLKLSAIVLTFLSILIGFLFWQAQVSILYIVLAFAVNIVVFFIVYWFTKERDISGLYFGQKALKYLSQGDLEISFILNMIQEDHTKLVENFYNSGQKNERGLRIDEVRLVITRALSSTLHALSNLLHLDIQGDSFLSIFQAVGGKFIVVAERGLSPEHVKGAQYKFSYIEKPVGIAGHALYRRETISIPDLSDDQNALAKEWIPTYYAETQRGSIICIPIIAGLDSENGEQLGVLSLTSVHKNAFNSATTRSLLVRFAVRVEILLLCLKLIDLKSGNVRL